MKNVLFIASEAVPFIKTGGLADVVSKVYMYSLGVQREDGIQDSFLY